MSSSDRAGGGELIAIDADECRRLLATMAVGRLAVCRPGGAPLVVPVNYALTGDRVVFRTDPGTALDLLREHPVSFQVDAIDPYHRTGWSVLVSGTAVEIEPDATITPVEPWVAGQRAHWIRVEPATISGRRIALPELPDFPEDARGYL